MEQVTAVNNIQYFLEYFALTEDYLQLKDRNDVTFWEIVLFMKEYNRTYTPQEFYVNSNIDLGIHFP